MSNYANLHCTKVMFAAQKTQGFSLVTIRDKISPRVGAEPRPFLVAHLRRGAKEKGLGVPSGGPDNGT